MAFAAGWGLTFRQLATAKARARISVWVMLDEAHPDQIGTVTSRDWEVYPVLMIEGFTAAHLARSVTGPDKSDGVDDGG